MKKLWTLMILLPLLLGCAAQPVFETVEDTLTEPAAELRQAQFALPEDAAASVLQRDDGNRVFLCGDWEIRLETIPAGSLSQTLRSVTGRTREDLTVLKTENDSIRRYDCAWASAGEEGELVAHTAILDDGACHYCLTALWDADRTADVREAVEELFASFTLVESPGKV